MKIQKSNENLTCYLIAVAIDDVKEVIRRFERNEIWELFDGIKEKFGLRVFGKGYMYRIFGLNDF
jgi:hypothetical protein